MEINIRRSLAAIILICILHVYFTLFTMGLGRPSRFFITYRRTYFTLPTKYKFLSIPKLFIRNFLLSGPFHFIFPLSHSLKAIPSCAICRVFGVSLPNHFCHHCISIASSEKRIQKPKKMYFNILHFQRGSNICTMLILC